MGQQTLQTIIAISGRVDNSFGQIGEALIGLGSQIDGISQKIIDFGKESVETYVKYDDAMRETQAVGGYTAAEMEKLDALNRQIAQTTTYSNLQSANAMVLIAQAGMDVEDTYSLLPSVLDLAMAGNLDLADSVDYLLSSLTSMGYGMEYASTLTDQMAKTAAIGMTDIDTLGESMMRLGSASGEFFSSSEEILTILSAMSQFGHDQRGAQAGTWLRNFMLSLAAPAGSIDDIVDAMEQLGIAQEEIDTYAENKSNGQAAMAVQSLMEQGLKVYDEHGKLLPAIDIIKSLRDTVHGSAEYSQDLTELTGALNAAGGDIDSFLTNTEGLTDNALYNVFAKIFGKRGITTAMNLISISDEEWDQTFAEIVNADGFAQSMSDTMQGGLGGALRELEAAYTEFQTTIGESLAPAVENVAGWLKEIVTGLSNMDEGTLDALVSGVSVIAAAGPGLLLAGSAFRLIGYLLTPAGGIGLGLVALTAAAAAVKELSEADMAGNFGDMKLDAQSLSEYVVGLGADFKTAYSEVNEFNAALEQSVTDYTNASQTFSSELLTAMLTGTTLTEDAKTKLQGLGQDMYKSLVEGINNSTAASMSYFEMLFGGEGTAEYDPQYQEIISLTNQSYLDALATAERLSQGLRDALTSAFDDGTVSADEYAEIQGWMQSYNDAMSKAAAEAQREQDYVTQQMLFHKAQTASYDEIKELASEVQTERDSLLASAEEEYLKERFKLEYRGASEETLSALDAQYERHVTEQSAKYDGILTRLWESSIEQSDLGTAYGELEGLADRVLGGELSAESAVKLFKDAYGNNSLAGEADWMGNNTRTQLGEYLARMIASYGGYEGLTAKADYYDSVGDTESANNLRRLYAMQQINDNFASTGVLNYNGVLATLFGDSTIFSSAADEYGIMQAQKSPFLEYMQDYISSYTAETARQTAAAFSGENGRMDDYLAEVGKGQNANDVNGAWSKMSKTARSEYQRMVESLRAVYDFDKVLADETNVFAQDGSAFQDDAAVYSLLYGNASRDLEKYKITTEIDPILDEGAMQDAVGDQTITIPVEPEVTEYSAEIAKQTIAAVGGGMDAYLAEIGNGQDARDVNAAWSEMSREARTEYQNMVDALQEVYDFDRVLAGETNMFAEAGSAFRDDAAVYSLLYGNASHDLEKYKITAEIDPVLDEGAVQDAAGSQEIKVPVEPEVPEDTGELEMPSTVTGAAEAAQAAHSDAQSVMDDPLAQAVHVSDNGSAAATRGAIASTFSTPITQYINVVQRGGGGLMNRLAKYADGGRADEPSIFGEAGPEWAIPEEHSERTAWLLDAARQASGFTWPELLTRNGGLNAGGGNTPSQLIYSPTIIANDANGVEQRLIEDKARLEKWYQDKQLHDDVEVYA